MIVFVIVLLVLAVAAGAAVGAWVIDGYWQERSRQEAREAQLTALWRVMHAAHRIDAAYWVARREMQREAERHRE